MRSKPKMILLALVAVLAVSATAASTALASPEWYFKNKGVYKKLTTSMKVVYENPFELIDTKDNPVSLAVSCKGTGEGVIKAGAKGEITSFGIGLPENCKGVPVKGITDCEKFETAESADLPWETELYKEGSEIRDKILGTPIWSFTCKSIFGPYDDTCGVSPSTSIVNNASSGLVEAKFDAKSGKTSCSEGGKEAGEWKGTLKIKLTESEKKEGLEALKVE
jgi:hypothetical protein